MEFLTFEPILSNSPEDITAYMEQYGTPPWENDFFKQYISSQQPDASTSTFSSDFWNNPQPDQKPTYDNHVMDYFRDEKYKKELRDLSEIPESKLGIIQEIDSLYISNDDKDYLKVLAKRESNFDPQITNQFGYFGLYQFGDSALKETGFTKESFKDTLNQHEAALKLAERNENALSDIINQYVGTRFKDIKITRNGIRAAAHLLGARTVKDWFNNTTNTKLAKNGFVDGNGTHITEYLRMF